MSTASVEVRRTQEQDPAYRPAHPPSASSSPAVSSASLSSSSWSVYRVITISPSGFGPDATIVTEFYDCSAAPEHERLEMGNGSIWAEAMAETLARLDVLCARGNRPSPSPQ